MLKKIYLICFICLYAIACNEEPNSPNDQEVLLKSNLIAKSSNHKVIIGTSSSENTLGKNEEIKNKIEFDAIGNISYDNENSSISISSNSQDNSYLPSEIKYSSKDLYYKIKGKNKNILMKDNHDKIKKIMKENRKRTEKWKEREKINWETLTLETKLAKFIELGYNVEQVDNDLYEVSRDFEPLDNGDKIHIKTVIDFQTNLPKSSRIYKDGNLISEHISENESGNYKTYSKVYGKQGFRNEKNILIVKENK